MALFLMGAITMGYSIAGLFFLRYWKETQDRLFLMFSIAFWLLAVQRLGLALTTTMLEDTTYFYLLRLLAFGMILFAIIDKNRPQTPPR
ncbi:MAG: hypothetical protein H0T73_18535 [Ardenticatenales bacterium]|nr:hypothetical protein [Ardenticatenales bacterium]